MSEQPYTPTTDEVRGDFVMLNESHHPLLTGLDLGNAFDRWLAGVKADAWEEGAMQGHDDNEFGVEVWTNPYRNGAGRG